MILNRIGRGVKYTRILVQSKFGQRSKNYKLDTQRIAKNVRNMAIAALVVRVITLPIPSLAAPSHELAASDSGPVPDQMRIDQEVLKSLSFAPDSNYTIKIDNGSLANLSIGSSLADVQKQAEEVAKQKAEQDKIKDGLNKKAQSRQGLVTTVVAGAGEVQDIARQLSNAAFGESEWPYMSTLIVRESNFNPNAVNPTTGACGIPQALPCSKLSDTSVSGQINWMINYVKNRYGTPSQAISFHNAHNWY